MTRPVFLLTDFGVTGYYQGVMHGVIARIAPEAGIHDLSHGIRQGDLRDAAYTLESAWDHLPEDAVVVAVIDPGVGTRRHILGLREGSRTLVAPDNGLATLLITRHESAGRAGAASPELRIVDRSDLCAPAPSATFHGRDIFSPIAAHLATGLRFEDLGPLLDEPELLTGLEATRNGDVLEGEVLCIDPFGNVITTIRAAHLDPSWDHTAVRLEIGEHVFTGLHRTFADVAPGDPVLYVGSTDRLELALRDDDAARSFELAPGDPLRLTP